MSKSKTLKRQQQKALQRRLKITRKKLAESKRCVTKRNRGRGQNFWGS